MESSGAGGTDGDRARSLGGGDNSAAEGDVDRGSRYGLVRCASQSSLDESSQTRGGGGGAGGDGAGEPHAGSLLAALARLRSAGALCDVRLMARAAAGAERGPPLWAHRAVLAAASPYFHAMFTQFEERDLPEVTIQGVEPLALEAILEWVYCPRSLRVTEANVQALLAGGSLLALGGVRDAAAAFLAHALQPDNALGIRAFADLHACADLRRQASDYVDAHFTEVVDSEEFLALPADTLAALLDSDRLVAPDEEVVLDAVIRWMRHAPDERQRHLAALLEHVRLPLLAQEALVARAAAAPLAGAAADLRVKDLVIEALSYHLLPPARRALAAAGSARARPRAATTERGALLVAGGQAPKAIRDVELLRLEGGGWRAAAPLPSRRCRAGLAVLEGRAYAVGGFNGTLRVRSVDVYDIAADAWSAGPPLGARRSTLGVAVLAGTIYAVGGFDGVSGLSSAEALDAGAAAPAWRTIAHMSTRRSSVGVAVLEGRLYAVGGYDGAARQCLHTVERYDPAADAWESVAEMAMRRSGCGVGVADGALYAVGGHDGPAVRRSVERYRPDGECRAWSAGGGAWRVVTRPRPACCRRLELRARHALGAAQRGRGGAPREAVRGGRGRRRRQPRLRGGVRPRHRHVDAAGRHHVHRALLRRRGGARAGALVTRAAARVPVRPARADARVQRARRGRGGGAAGGGRRRGAHDAARRARGGARGGGRGAAAVPGAAAALARAPPAAARAPRRPAHRQRHRHRIAPCGGSRISLQYSGRLTA